MDREAAWKLFGSNDVAGQIVYIADVAHVVTGVVEHEDSNWYKVAGLDGAMIYVSYDTLKKYGSNNGINHFEIVMPNPVDKDMCYKDYPSIIKNGGYNNWTGAKVLDEKGFEKGDETYGVFALKELILIAKKLGIVTQGVDENNAFGDGTEAAVNQILKRGGYAQNGIAGYGLIKYLAGLIKKKLG